MKKLFLLLPLIPSLLFAQGTQTYNYATQDIAGSTTYTYASVTYDLSAAADSQNTRFLFTTLISALVGPNNAAYFNLAIDGVEYNIATTKGAQTETVTGELILNLSAAAHTIVLKVQNDNGNATRVTTPQLIVSPTDVADLQDDITALTNLINGLTTTVTNQGTTITGLESVLADIQSKLDSLSIGGGSDSSSLTSQITNLESAVASLNKKLDKIEDNSDPLNPVNLGLSFGTALGANLLGNVINDKLINGSSGSSPVPQSSMEPRPGYYE